MGPPNLTGQWGGAFLPSGRGGAWENRVHAPDKGWQRGKPGHCKDRAGALGPQLDSPVYNSETPGAHRWMEKIKHTNDMGFDE